MSHLQSFLRGRYFQEDKRAFELLLNTEQQDDVLLPSDLTILCVVRMLWSAKSELVIMYRGTSQLRL
eukprot:CAMPEP_0206234712 /NCGR_PEP_ID=MMETSP0047_2-20121206/12739_1 /ASSEMBLY_ACC=CAM_ASM_000192 /TAXON_ID=195065 /ORGANISM="Chroomonas mesostigmatica_cf, Strain CCMP1168" /LENGTH=66 /DNA_ID=CAMNT_0053658821 /DNA_START=125 /DNA_END=325 /DNA_ORIENTATION=+